MEETVCWNPHTSGSDHADCGSDHADCLLVKDEQNTRGWFAGKGHLKSKIFLKKTIFHAHRDKSLAGSPG